MYLSYLTTRESGFFSGKEKDNMRKEFQKRISYSKDVVGITQQLVRIPSYVSLGETDKKVDERNANNWIVNFLQENTNLSIRKQFIQGESGRFNIIATNSDNPKLVFLGHTDTVRPSTGGQYDQLGGEIVDNKLIGLGSADMKSAVGAMLSAIAKNDSLPDMALLLYVDEEYDFAGMKQLIQDKDIQSWKPDLMITGDAGNLELGNGCRGIIEINAVINGKTAHASRPNLGINAIAKTVATIENLSEDLKNNTDNPITGYSTANLGYLEGGKAQSLKDDEVIFQKDVSNCVPDAAFFRLDVRSNNLDVTAATIIQKLQEYCQKNGLTMSNIEIQNDLNLWYTQPEKLQWLAEIMKKSIGEMPLFTPLQNKGYVDMAMLWGILGQPDAAAIGPGNWETIHKPDEFVEIEKLEKCRDIFSDVMQYMRRTKPEERQKAA